MKTIQFVFNGEFGWEVIHWQAYCRKIAGGYDQAFFVSSNAGSEPLYTDFAKEELRMTDRIIAWQKDRLIPFEEQEFIKFGKANPGRSPAILIHARNSRVAHKNYPVDMWQQLVKLIGDKVTIYSIGIQAHFIKGTCDIRGVPLKLLFDDMASAKCIIGPSSGPMHLASLCGCPQLVWGDGRTYRGQALKDRYQQSWNPYRTPVEFIETNLDWQPDPEEIYERVQRFL